MIKINSNVLPSFFLLLQLIAAETVIHMHIASMVIVFVIQDFMVPDTEETARNLSSKVVMESSLLFACFYVYLFLLKEIGAGK